MLHAGWSGMGWMWIPWLLPIVAGMALIGALVGRAGTHGTRRPSPEEILKERYARGEINGEEYRSALRDLRQ